MHISSLTKILLATAAFGPVSLASDSTIAAGAVYTMTNDAAGNAVLIFDRATDGALTFDQSVPTGGTGTGASLGNQGGLVLSQDERFLFAVNAGSHDVSVFEVLEDGLALVEQKPSGGLQPVSIAQHDDLVYVVNAGSDSFVGYRLGFDGGLDFIQDSRMGLSASGSAPAQIGFSPSGEYLYVTEKATSIITRVRLNAQGRPIARSFVPSQGMTPFGFAFGVRNQLIVSEAAGGQDLASTVTSYELTAGGLLAPVSTSVPTTQTAACWIATTPGGRIAYASNTGSDSVSSFLVGFDGSLSLLDATAANTAPGPLDMAITRDGRFLYVLDGGGGVIGDYVIEPDGALTGIPGGQMVVPAGASGLAVR